MKNYSSLFSLEGKVAIVTGATGILGPEFCSGLASAGATVVVADLDQQKCQEVAEELTRLYGGRAMGIVCDVSQPDQVKALVERVVGEYGEINVLHNNAATKSKDTNAFFALFEEYSLDVWREIMAVNIDGMFLMAQAVGRQMVKQGKGGSIIQTASITGVYAPDQRIYRGIPLPPGVKEAVNTPAVYTTSKAAVIGLTKYLASYWGEQKIRVNALSPGGVENAQNPEFIKRYSNRVPLGRMADRNDLVGAVVYLASDAALYVTGQNIIVDGGLSCW